MYMNDFHFTVLPPNLQKMYPDPFAQDKPDKN